MDNNNLVQGGEELYRNVRAGQGSIEYSYDDEGRLRIQPEAFRDRYRKPSVDRASLVDYNPSVVLLNPTNGIVSLMARDVRAIADVVTTTRDKTVNHVVDVVHDPTPQRQSHAIINVNPEFFDSESKQKKVFKFLQKALARLATINGWTLRPGED